MLLMGVLSTQALLAPHALSPLRRLPSRVGRTAAETGVRVSVCTTPRAGWTPEERIRNDQYASQVQYTL